MFNPKTHKELSSKGGKASISSQFKGKSPKEISEMMRKRGKKGLLVRYKKYDNKYNTKM